MREGKRVGGSWRLWLVLAVAAGLSWGCAGKPLELGRDEVKRQSETLALSDVKRGYYSFDDKNTVTIVLVDGPIESPTRALTVRYFWKPRAGRTPIDPTATNATIQYLVFGGGEGSTGLGVYAGAGYLFPSSVFPPGTGVGAEDITAEIWQAHLRITDRSGSFQDAIGQAMLDGTISARRDDLMTSELLRRLNVLVHTQLGYPRFVKAGESEMRIW